MQYLNSFIKLKNLTEVKNTFFHFEGVDVFCHEFESESYNLLPGKDIYRCALHSHSFKIVNPFPQEIGEIDNNINIKDIEIEEDRKFTYRIFMPSSKKRVDHAIFLFHGFNEKSWTKYLPWAQYITERTGHAVILFPIAFHMNRALSLWSDKTKMFKLSEERKKIFPDIVGSSLANVAISMRLNSRPQRFIWSGLQTYYDILQLMKDIKADKISQISPYSDFHIVAYSVGCFLAEILKLTNYNNYFDNSKICFFCGGAVFNRLCPVSGYIIDSEANIALYSFLVEHLDKYLNKDEHLNHYINGPHPEGKVFHAMLNYNEMREFRESLFSKYKNDFMAITLKKDSVIPPHEIINTLQGALRDIPIPVEVLDFPFPYTHINLFPFTGEKHKDQIDVEFRKVFEKISQFIIT